MRIESIEPICLLIGARSDQLTSRLAAETGQYLLVKLTLDNGLVGWGNCFAYRDPREVYAAVERIAWQMKGQELCCSRNTITFLVEGLGPRHSHQLWAAAGIELALWDLQAKIKQAPLDQILPDGEAFRREVPAYASLPHYESPKDVAAAALDCVRRGYQAVKLHQIDVASVAAAREAIGPDRELMLDVGRAWDVSTASEMCNRLSPYRLLWVEEPIAPGDDFASLARLRMQTDVPIAIGENILTPAGFSAAIERDCADIFQPSLLKIGGLTRLMEILRLLDAASQ